MIALKDLIPLPDGIGEDGGARSIWGLGSATTDGVLQLVYEVDESVRRMSLLHALTQRVSPFSLEAVGGRNFTPAPHNAFDLILGRAQERQGDLAWKDSWRTMRQQTAPDESHATDFVGRLIAALFSRATFDLYYTGIIGGQSLLDSLSAAREKLVEFFLRDGTKLSPEELLLAHLDKIVNRWNSLGDSPPSKQEKEDMFVLIVRMATLLVAHYTRVKPVTLPIIL